MLPIILPIFWHTEETAEAIRIGIAHKFSHCVLRKVRFYSIAGISLVKEDENHYTNIFSNGETFVCSLPPHKVAKLLENNTGYSRAYIKKLLRWLWDNETANSLFNRKTLLNDNTVANEEFLMRLYEQDINMVLQIKDNPNKTDDRDKESISP